MSYDADFRRVLETCGSDNIADVWKITDRVLREDVERRQREEVAAREQAELVKKRGKYRKRSLIGGLAAVAVSGAIYVVIGGVQAAEARDHLRTTEAVEQTLKEPYTLAALGICANTLRDLADGQSPTWRTAYLQAASRENKAAPDCGYQPDESESIKVYVEGGAAEVTLTYSDFTERR